MTDVIVAPQVIKIEVALEAWARESPVGKKLVLIAVEQIYVTVIIDGFGVFKEQIGFDYVVMIEEADEIAFCSGLARIRVQRDSEVLLKLNYLDPCVDRSNLVDVFFELCVFGRGVYKDTFPLRICLASKEEIISSNRLTGVL